MSRGSVAAARWYARIDEQTGELALRAGVRLQRDGVEAGDSAERRLELAEDLADSPAACSTGTNGCDCANSGHVTGIISAAALSFIVHEPSGIIEVSSPMSLRSRLRM